MKKFLVLFLLVAQFGFTDDLDIQISGNLKQSGQFAEHGLERCFGYRCGGFKHSLGGHVCFLRLWNPIVHRRYHHLRQRQGVDLRCNDKRHQPPIHNRPLGFRYRRKFAVVWRYFRRVRRICGGRLGACVECGERDLGSDPGGRVYAKHHGIRGCNNDPIRHRKFDPLGNWRNRHSHNEYHHRNRSEQCDLDLNPRRTRQRKFVREIRRGRNLLGCRCRSLERNTPGCWRREHRRRNFRSIHIANPLHRQRYLPWITSRSGQDAVSRCAEERNFCGWIDGL